MKPLPPPATLSTSVVRCNHQRQKVLETGEPMPCATPRCPEGIEGEYWWAVIWPESPPSLNAPMPDVMLRQVLYKRVESRLGRTNFSCFTWQEIPETTCPPSSPTKSATSSEDAPAKNSEPMS